MIDGIPYSMSPSPVRKHQQLAMSLTLQIGNSIKGQKEECSDCNVFYELDWILSDNTVVRPDILVTCDKTGDFITKPPLLVVEILSPSTGLKDRHLKFELYQEQGVKYYLIADPNSRLYQIYELINGHYKERTELSFFEIHDKCGIDINLDEAMAELD